MSVQYIQEQKKQKYLIIVFLVVLVITLTVLWFGFFKDKASVSFRKFLSDGKEFQMEGFSRKNINIDFKLLESQEVKNLYLFNDALPFEGEVGRKEPFKPIN